MNKNKITSKLNIILLIGLSSAVLYFSLKDNFNEIVKDILNMNPWWLLVSLLLIFGYWLFKTIAFHSLIIKFDSDYKFIRAFKLIMLTQFFNGITPSSSGGQPFVVYTLKKDGVKGTDGTNIVVQDFIIYQIALISLGVLAIFLNYCFNIFKTVGILQEVVLIGFFINVGVVVVLFMVAFAKKFNKILIKIAIKILSKFKLIKNKDTTIDSWEERINDFHEGASMLFKDKKHFMKTLGINVLALLSLYLIPVTILYSMGNYSSFNGILAVITSSYVMLVGSMVPMPGGTGGLEFAFIAFFGNFLTGSILNAMMLLWRFITYYLGMIIGALVFNVWRKRD